MSRSRPSPLVTKAIRTAAEQLARMPRTPEVLALKTALAVLEGEVAGWASSLPSNEEREGMMKRILAVHLAITKLPRKR